MDIIALSKVGGWFDSHHLHLFKSNHFKNLNHLFRSSFLCGFFADACDFDFSKIAEIGRQEKSKALRPNQSIKILRNFLGIKKGPYMEAFFYFENFVSIHICAGVNFPANDLNPHLQEFFNAFFSRFH